MARGKHQKRPVEVEDAPTNPTAAYLASLGVADVDLSVPDIDSLRVAGSSPTAWVDKHGNAPDPNLQLFLIASDVPDKATAKRNAEKKGYRIMPAEAGLHWQGRTPKDGDVVMFRTRAQKAAYEAAKRATQARQRGRHTQTTGSADLQGEVVETVTVGRDRAVALRD